MTATVIRTVVLLMGLVCAAKSTCPEIDQIHCGTSDRCTRIRYICDGDNDCGDSTDEESSLCAVWRNSDCERNHAKCTRSGRSDCVTISTYCTLTDPPCEGTVDPRLCQMLKDGKIQSLNAIQMPTPPAPTEPTTIQPSIHVRNENWSEQFLLKLNSTIHHPDCPMLYTKVGEHCLSIFFIGNMSWMEARTFCQTIGGDLFTITKEFNMFATLLQHFTTHQVTADFWIGGRYINDTLGWTWVDGSPMPVGSPYWAVRHEERCTNRKISYDLLNVTLPANDGVCYNYVQAPRVPPMGHCSSLSYEYYHYMSDNSCFIKKSPLCVLVGEHPKQAQ
ncbi:uncharacterized protein [Procambarus clarkii]|uniref:uncharacterized protein isoform X2 n=1 Tax=Procambarus clarkii TaxID=6728 RepID=UPI001E6748EB|nr:uncharacterized protein LOC123755941 isoform X2 [Procambarus clarkii]XP_045594869.1 uncharacterized protein LOC123755941 isoform X2 [Procambarus clarkii]